MYGGRLQVPAKQPLHHPAAHRLAGELRSMLWFYGQLGHVTGPQILCFMGCLHIPSEKWFTFWALSTLLNQLLGSCAGVKGICVSVGTRRGGRNREAGGTGLGGACTAPSFLSLAPGSYC